MIVRENLRFWYDVAPSWQERHVLAPPALRELVAQLRPMLVEMTGQVVDVLTVVILSGVVSYVALIICKYTTGLRVEEQEEREGLDIGSHGERAYS